MEARAALALLNPEQNERGEAVKRIILGALAAACTALVPASAHAAPIRECVTHMGGLYVNLTTRNVTCGTAR